MTNQPGDGERQPMRHTIDDELAMHQGPPVAEVVTPKEPQDDEQNELDYAQQNKLALPPLDAIAEQEIYEARDAASIPGDLYAELDRIRAVLHCRERQLRAALSSLEEARRTNSKLNRANQAFMRKKITDSNARSWLPYWRACRRWSQRDAAEISRLKDEIAALKERNPNG